MTNARIIVLLVLAAAGGPAYTQEVPRRITIIYDAFGKPSGLERDWGFAALVEYGGKRILFDTGNNVGIFERNVERLGVDLTRSMPPSCPIVTAITRPGCHCCCGGMPA